jgi:hypothetical protein
MGQWVGQRGLAIWKTQSDLADFRRFSRTALHPFWWLSEVVVSKMLMLSMGYYLTTCYYLWGYIESDMRLRTMLQSLAAPLSWWLLVTSDSCLTAFQIRYMKTEWLQLLFATVYSPTA